MKSFADYLTESKKTYAFLVKVAGELDAEFEPHLKTAMERFSVAKFSKGKSTPIQETLVDFPTIKNQKVTTFEIEVHYPTTPQVLQNYVADCCKCDKGMVVVRGMNEAAVSHQELENRKESEDKPLIGQCDMPSSDNQDLVGEKWKMAMLKDLMKEKNAGQQYTGVNDVLLADKLPEEKVTDMAEGNVISPIGSKGKK
jgi:hypothetical protein